MKRSPRLEVVLRTGATEPDRPCSSRPPGRFGIELVLGPIRYVCPETGALLVGPTGPLGISAADALRAGSASGWKLVRVPSRHVSLLGSHSHHVAPIVPTPATFLRRVFGDRPPTRDRDEPSVRRTLDSALNDSSRRGRRAQQAMHLFRLGLMEPYRNQCVILHRDAAAAPPSRRVMYRRAQVYGVLCSVHRHETHAPTRSLLGPHICEERSGRTNDFCRAASVF